MCYIRHHDANISCVIKHDVCRTTHARRSHVMASGSQGLHTKTTQDPVSDGSITDYLSECDCGAEEKVSPPDDEVDTPEATTSRAGEEGSVLSISSNGVDSKTNERDEEDIPSTVATRPEDEGAGWFRIHSLPTKLVASLNKHELVDSWPKLKREIALKIWGEFGKKYYREAGHRMTEVVVNVDEHRFYCLLRRHARVTRQTTYSRNSDNKACLCNQHKYSHKHTNNFTNLK